MAEFDPMGLEENPLIQDRPQDSLALCSKAIFFLCEAHPIGPFDPDFDYARAALSVCVRRAIEHETRRLGYLLSEARHPSSTSKEHSS